MPKLGCLLVSRIRKNVFIKMYRRVRKGFIEICILKSWNSISFINLDFFSVSNNRVYFICTQCMPSEVCKNIVSYIEVKWKESD